MKNRGKRLTLGDRRGLFYMQQILGFGGLLIWEGDYIIRGIEEW